MDMDDLLSCTVCMESFDENIRPRTLPCGHTFCTECIHNTIKDGSIECPHCKVPNRASDATDFPINYIAEAMIIKFKEVNFGATLTHSPESDISTFEPQEPANLTQEAINDLKEKLRNTIEVSKATKVEAKNYRAFINKRLSRHKEFITKISHILQLHEDVINKLNSEYKKVTKFLKEQEKYQTEVSNNISKLDSVTEGSDILSTCEELEKLHDALNGWNMKCKIQLPCTASYRNSEEMEKKTAAALKQFSEKVDVATERIDLSNSYLSVADKKDMLEYLLHSENLKESFSQASKIVEKGLICAVLGREGRVYTARISSGNGRTYLHCLKENKPPANVLSVQYQALTEMLNKDAIVTFMDLAWEGSIQGRIQILLSPQTPLATQFWKLCSGEQGQSYLHTRFLEVLSKESDNDERIVGGDYERDNGRGGAPLFSGLNNDSVVYHRKQEAGCVGTVDFIKDGPKSSQFRIYTVSYEGPEKGIFGQVQDGLDVLEAAVKLEDIKKVRIEDCGIVLPQ